MEGVCLEAWSSYFSLWGRGWRSEATTREGGVVLELKFCEYLINLLTSTSTALVVALLT